MSTPRSLSDVVAGELVESAVFADGNTTTIPAAEFFKCRFEGCELSGATCKGAVFESCHFVDCDLTRVAWAGAPLRDARFMDCKLVGADFGRAGDNPELHFERCLLRYASFDGVNLGSVVFIDCQLQESSFVEANLRDADFGNSDLSQAVIKGATLAGADFSRAVGVFFDPKDNQSKDAFIAVDAAVAMAQARGLRVDGYDKRREKKGPKRR